MLLLMKNMTNKAQIRYNFITGRSVAFAPERIKRPNDTKKSPKSSLCPFCAGNVKSKSILSQTPKGKKWQTAAVKNLFPVLSKGSSQAYGYQEVIIDTPVHEEDFADLKIKQIETVLQMFQIRSEKLKKDKKIHYILCFKNQGRAAGASLRHIHSQIFASTILPPDIIEERNRVALYAEENSACPYCELIKQEENESRKIYSDNNLIAFCPYASEYPYEVWITSRRHVDNIALLKPSEISSLAKCLKLIAQKLKDLSFDFNFFTHNDLDNQHQHFYLKVQPRPNVWAGVELGSGLIINSILPEEAANNYRQ